MNRLLVRIWLIMFISIFCVSSFVFILINLYYGTLFKNPTWAPVYDTAYLVQTILNETIANEYNLEDAINSLAKTLERPATALSIVELTGNNTTLLNPDDGKAIYSTEIDEQYEFILPLNRTNTAIAMTPLINQYSMYNSLTTQLLWLVWIFLLTTFSGIYIFLPINRRLSDLEHAAQAMASGDLSARVKQISKGHFGEVGLCFNQMATHIQLLVNNQQRLLSDFVKELQRANKRLEAHSDNLYSAKNHEQKEKSINRLNKALDNLEKFITQLLNNEKKIDLKLSPAQKEPHQKETTNTVSSDSKRSFTDSKISKIDDLKLLTRLALCILITLLFNHSYGLLYSQIGYRYIPGIENWYPARTIPKLIQEAINVHGQPEKAFLEKLSNNLQRSIEIKPSDTMSGKIIDQKPVKTSSLYYGTYNEQQVYLAPVLDGEYTLIIDNGLKFYRHKPSILGHIVAIPLELVITLFSSILLAWPMVYNIKTFEMALNRFRFGDLNARVNINPKLPIGGLVSQFNMMADKLQHLLTNRRHLIQAVAHEIRTPIYRMYFNLEMLLNDKNTQLYMKRIDDTQEDIEELNDLADELSAFTKIGSWLDNSIKISVYEEILATINPFKASNSHIDIMLYKSSEETYLMANPVYFKRVIQNIVSNAVRHASSSVAVSVTHTASMAHIDITDDGPGVPQDARESIFEPFARVDDSRNRKTGGFGLGLAIVKRIIDQYQGSLSVTDNIPNGTKFTVHWPLHSPAIDSYNALMKEKHLTQQARQIEIDFFLR